MKISLTIGNRNESLAVPIWKSFLWKERGGRNLKEEKRGWDERKQVGEKEAAHNRRKRGQEKKVSLNFIPV